MLCEMFSPINQGFKLVFPGRLGRICSSHYSNCTFVIFSLTGFKRVINNIFFNFSYLARELHNCCQAVSCEMTSIEQRSDIVGSYQVDGRIMVDGLTRGYICVFTLRLDIEYACMTLHSVQLFSQTK